MAVRCLNGVSADGCWERSITDADEFGIGPGSDLCSGPSNNDLERLEFSDGLESFRGKC
jgi:hypothetical protein